MLFQKRRILFVQGIATLKEKIYIAEINFAFKKKIL